MAKQAHDHQNPGSHHGHHAPQRKSLHKDWRMWIAIVLMLGAMVIYVMSFDESIQPQAPQQPPVPAAP